jgi:hypothetical protein
MNEKTKYLAILLVAAIVSAATSYTATLSLPKATVTVADVESLVEQQVTEELSPVKVTLVNEVSFWAPGPSYVKAYSDVTLKNLTIVYKYTCLGNGTVTTKSIEYGTFIPAWGAGTIIEAGAVPEGLYKIPDYIIQASSTTETNPSGNLVFDTPPQLEVLEVYGYT